MLDPEKLECVVMQDVADRIVRSQMRRLRVEHLTGVNLDEGLGSMVVRAVNYMIEPLGAIIAPSVSEALPPLEDD
jgi:hypothetical protein